MAKEQLNIFIDLDGTLVDISNRHYQAYRDSTAQFFGQPLEKTKYWQLKVQGTPWSKLLKISGLSSELEEQFLKDFADRIEQIKYLKLDSLVPGATQTLQRLSSQHNCYLITLRRNKENLVKQIHWLDLGRYFIEILQADSKNTFKVELIKARLNGDKGIVIGDTEEDIQTGKKLGLTTISVLNGIRSKEVLAALKPDHIIDSIEQLDSII
jgi:phosphoglycolate phosphatase-like HAD superfamily hydrolase